MYVVFKIAKFILQNCHMSVTLCKKIICLALQLTKWETCKSVTVILRHPEFIYLLLSILEKQHISSISILLSAICFQ